MDYQRKQEIEKHLWLARNLVAIDGSTAQQAKMYIADVQTLQVEIAQQETKYALLREELKKVDEQADRQQGANYWHQAWVEAVNAPSGRTLLAEQLVRELTPLVPKCQELETALADEKRKSALYEKEAQEYLHKIEDLRETYNLLEYDRRVLRLALRHYAKKKNWQPVSVRFGPDWFEFGDFGGALWNGTQEPGWAIARRVLNLAEDEP